MAVVYNFSKFVPRSYLFNKTVHNAIRNVKYFQTSTNKAKPKSITKLSLIGASVGALVGAGYSVNKISRDRKNISKEGTQTEIEVLKEKLPIQPSRKVRVFLDYHGISYDVVEVDPVLRKEIKWSPYRKVPILLAQVDGGYQPLNDSTMIISVLGSILADKEKKIEEVAKYYPSMFYRDENGKFKQEIVNKYFLMYQNTIPEGKSLDDIGEERKWRKWVDDVLVHVLSPNVYRTTSEAYQAFNWFSQVGRWEEYFPTWERLLMINVGAYAMWLISKRLKKRHNLKDDVRQSLYGEVNYWLEGIKVKGTQFMGGKEPDFSDLAVFGILKSIEGCDAFKDLLNKTQIGAWFYAMQEKIDLHHGQAKIKS